MREPADPDSIRAFMKALGSHVRGPGRIYLTGGATALLNGWRKSTIDIDLKADPEPAGLFEAIASLKDTLSLNVELAAPDQFIPEVPGWRERSAFIVTHNQLEFRHYDYYSQALAKIERGHERDQADVRAMLDAGLVTKAKLGELFQSIEPLLIRYPSIAPSQFRTSVEAVINA